MNKPAVFLSAIAGAVMVLMTSCGRIPTTEKNTCLTSCIVHLLTKCIQLTWIFPDSLTMQAPVKEPFPVVMSFWISFQQQKGMKLQDRMWKSASDDGRNMLEGERLYGIYCTHCHGESGQGDGNLVKIRKFPPPPVIHHHRPAVEVWWKIWPMEKFFHTITYGISLMGPHASELTRPNVGRLWCIFWNYRGQVSGAGCNDSTTTAAKRFFECHSHGEIIQLNKDNMGHHGHIEVTSTKPTNLPSVTVGLQVWWLSSDW